MSRPRHRPRVAILASGEGTTAEAFVHATQNNGLDVEVGLVVCNNPPEKAGVYSRVAKLNKQYGLDIQTAEISHRAYPGGNVGRGQTLAESSAICELVRHGGFAHLALMGYMKIVRGELLEEFGWLPSYTSIYQARMTNSHPGPLPETADTHGLGVSQRVLDLRMTASAYYFHLVSAGVDKGPIFAHHLVDVEPGDTAQSLFERVQITEKAELPGALDAFLRAQGDYNANS